MSDKNYKYYGDFENAILDGATLALRKAGFLNDFDYVANFIIEVNTDDEGFETGWYDMALVTSHGKHIEFVDNVWISKDFYRDDSVRADTISADTISANTIKGARFNTSLLEKIFGDTVDDQEDVHD